MKIKFTLLMTLMLGLVVFGCKTKLPAIASIVQPVAKMADNVIDTFEDKDAFANPNLRGAPNGAWTAFGTSGFAFLKTSGYMMDNPAPDAVNSSPIAAHMFGTLTDPQNASYPEATLQLLFNKSPYYDASSFTGIKYQLYVPAIDSAMKRRFKIAIKKTVPAANGGNCTTQCWDHFGLDFTTTTGWQQYTVTFATATRENWGSVITPATLTGSNLQDLFRLDWCESRNNVSGTSNIDFWVDNVEFF